MPCILLRSAAAVSALLCLSSIASAQMAPATRAILDRAAASGDAANVETVARFAKEANPGDTPEIDAYLANFRQQASARAAAAEVARREAIEHRGVLDGWSGQGQIGASRATGNARNTAVSMGLALARIGNQVDWKFRALADFQRTDGATTQEQFLAELSPQYRFNDRLFAYGLGRWERDRFQGYSSRITASGGIGYRVIAEDNMHLDLKAGPAWRRSTLIDPVTRARLGRESGLGGLADADFGWQVSPNLRLGQTASLLVEGGNTSLAGTTSLDAKLVGALSARFSYTVEHESNPPAGAVNTDTLTRFTLVYDF